MYVGLPRKKERHVLKKLTLGHIEELFMTVLVFVKAPSGGKNEDMKFMDIQKLAEFIL